ncbi:MAG: T9SS type A sorting domain-containing protein [Chitinophagales bacterium]|nr:T9SS type A sorting domain-containing protein [Chitinophagales bacterium]MDW8274669.1 T9SS type A sorting domain-containing protein [Chitinophagales bacterium]
MYSTFQINQQGTNFLNTTLNQPGEIWLTTVGTTPQQMWILNQFENNLNVSEPEPFVGNEKVWIYYSAAKIDSTITQNRKFQLRQCETPMNQISNIIVCKNKSNDIGLYLYPNPTSDELIIKSSLELNDEAEISILDLSGKLLMSEEYQGAFARIPITNFNRGFYLAVIKFKDGGLLTSKFIKQ